MKHSFTHAAMFTRKCLDLYNRPMDGAVYMTIARGLIYMRSEKNIGTSQYKFFPNWCSILGSKMLKFDKDIAGGEKKQHGTSALIYYLPHHVFHLLAYSSNGVHLYLLPTQGLMSSHRVFRLDLIRQHPAAPETPRLVKGQCCSLDNFRARLP